jgi:hypothetical protein
MAKIECDGASPATQGAHYELRYQPFVDDGRVYAFPCDLEGHVDIDTLSEAAKLDYMYARALVGREFAMPDVQALAAQR